MDPTACAAIAELTSHAAVSFSESHCCNAAVPVHTHGTTEKSSTKV